MAGNFYISFRTRTWKLSHIVNGKIYCIQSFAFGLNYLRCSVLEKVVDRNASAAHLIYSNSPDNVSFSPSMLSHAKVGLTRGWMLSGNEILLVDAILFARTSLTLRNIHCVLSEIWRARMSIASRCIFASIVLFFHWRVFMYLAAWSGIKLAGTMKTLLVSIKFSKRSTSPNSAWRFLLMCFLVDNLIGQRDVGCVGIYGRLIKVLAM